MRNILYILLLISGTVFGQTEFDDMTSTPSSSGSDQTIIVRSGTTYRITRAVQQGALYDSIQISTDTAAVHDGKINTNIDDISTNSDSITIHTGDLAAILARINVLEDSASIINDNTVAATLIARYEFELDTLDSEGNYHLTASETPFIYSDLQENNNHSANFGAAGRYLTSDSINLTNTFTLAGTIWSFGEAEERRTVMTNRGDSDTTGFAVVFDAVNRNLEFITWADTDDSLVAVTEDSIYYPTSYPGVPFRFMIVVNKVQSEVVIYINSVDETFVGVCETEFNSSDSIRYGEDFAGNYPLYARLDEVRLYVGRLTTLEVLSEYVLSDSYGYENDFTDPEILSTRTGTNRVLTINFNETMLMGVSDSVIAGLAYTADAAGKGIDSVSIDTSFTTMYVYTDSIGFDETLLISYVRPVSGGLTDEYGNTLKDTTDIPVSNQTLGGDTVSTAEVHYLFENSPVDNSDNGRTATYSGSYTAVSPLEGSYSVSMSGSATQFQMPEFTQNDTITLFCRVNYTNDAADTYLGIWGVTGETSGWRWKIDGANGAVDFDVKYANSTYASRTANSVLSKNTDYSLAVVIRGQHTRFFVDGVFLTAADSITNSNWPTTDDSINIGEGNTYGKIDDWLLLNRAIIDDSIVIWHNNPGFDFGGIGGADADPGDDPPADTSDVSTYADVILYANWEGSDIGLLDRTDLEEAYNVASVRNVNGFGYWDPTSFRDTSARVIDDGGNQVFRDRYIGGEYGLGRPPSRPYGDGFQYEVPVPGGYTEVYRTILVKADANYTVGNPIGRSGKWPGGITNGESVASGTGTAWETGCDGGPCNGSKVNFAFGGASGNFTKTIRSYIYHVDMAGDYGDIQYLHDPDNRSELYLFDDQWHSYTTREVLNTVGSSNGFVEFFIDGRYSDRVEGLRLRRSTSVDVDWINAYWFWGGSSDSYTCPNTTGLQMDEDYLFMYKDTYNVIRGFTKSPDTRVLELPNWDQETNSPVFQ